MASRGMLDYQVSVADAQGIHQEQRQRIYFAPGTTPNGKREPKTLTASVFTALSPPTGAVGLCLILNGATSLTLKSITGDNGILLTPATNPITGFDLIMPISGTVSIGLLNGSASDQVIEILWV